MAEPSPVPPSTPPPAAGSGGGEETGGRDAPPCAPAPCARSRPPARWEWIPVLLWPALAALAAWPPPALAGRFLPCVAAGLLPGCLWRLAGRRAAGVYRVGIALAWMAYLPLARRHDFARLDPARIADAWPWILAGLALVLTQPLLGAWRWVVLLRAAGRPLPYRDALRAGLAGTFVNLAVPGAAGGDLVRVALLAERHRGRDGRWGAAAASVLLDRLLGAPALFLLVAAAFAANAEWVAARPALAAARPFAGMAAAAALAGPVALAAFARPAHRIVSRRAARWEARGRPRAARWATGLAGVLAVYGGRWGAIGGGVAIGFASHVLTGMAALCFGAAAGVGGVPARAYFLLVPAGLAVNAAPLAPGGLGQGEWAFGELFDYAAPGEGNRAAGMLVMLGLRLGLLLAGLIGGGLVLAGRHRLGPPAGGP